MLNIGAMLPTYICKKKRMKKLILLFAPMLLAFNVVMAQPPNDDPCGAIVLDVEDAATCITSIPYVWTDATDTPGFPVPPCGQYNGGDVWFTFELTENASLFITTTTMVLPYDGVMALYKASSCDGTFELVDCNDDGGPVRMPEISLLNAESGTYYIRFWVFNGNTSGNIGICVAAAEPVVWPEPENDDPCEATELVVQDAVNCTPTDPILWSGATDTPGFQAPPCGSYNGGDVWFTFELIENSALYISTETAIAPYDGVMALYLADTCTGDFEYLTCDDNSGTGLMPRIQVFDAEPGTYYVRFWESTGNTSGNFGICVAASEPLMVPVNDTPCEAIDLVVEIGSGCTPDLPLTWANASAAPGVPNPTCVPASTLISGDIWFRFELTETQLGLVIDAIGSADGVMELFAADACDGTFTSLACDDDSGIGNNPRIQVAEMSAGVYYIRFWFYGNGPGSFTGSLTGICVAAITEDDFPPNNAPCSAFMLNVQDGLYCTPANPLSWENASNSMVLPSTICGSQNARDVWFYFEVDALSNVRIETLQGSGIGAMNDGVMELYRGNDCSDLERIGCDDDSGLNLMPELYMQLEPGRYYIRFWSFNGAASGNIGGICVTASEPGPLPNDFCEGAIAFPGIPLNGDCATVYANNSQATGGSPSFFAATPAPDGDLWFTFTVPVGEKQLYFEYENIAGNILRIISLHVSCTSVNMGGAELSITGPESGTGLLTGLIGGETYILRVFLSDLNSYSEFNLCLRLTPPPPINDECVEAISFPVIPQDGSCSKVVVDPQWATSEPAPNCNGTNDPDVWFSFVVPEGITNIIAEINPLNNLGAISGTFAVFSGSCGNLTQILCSEGNPPQLYGLTPNETYYIRAHSEGENGMFEICLRAAPPIPANDDCHNAIPFPTIPTDGTCAYMNINTKGSTGPVLGTCSLFPLDEYSSSWYSFVMPVGHTRLIFQQEPIGGPFSGLVFFTIFSENCGDLVEIACGGGTLNGQLIDGLVGGQTYYLEAQSQVYLWNDTGVDMCIRTSPPTPVNDVCEEALDFPIIALDGSWTTMNISTLSASGEMNGVFCGSSLGNDIWVRIQMPVGYDELRYRVTNDNGDYFVMALYEDNCDALELVGCMEHDFQMHTPIMVGGQSYLIRVVDIGKGTWADFTLNLAVPFEPLLNDDCEDALPFPTIPANGDCVSVNGETFQATGVPDPTCPGNESDDIWYYFQVPLDVKTLKFTLTDSYGQRNLRGQLYEGTCGELIHVNCIESFPWPHVEYELTSGGLYFLRIFTLSSSSSSGFELCVSAVSAPPNDECVNAISITDNPGEYVNPGIQTTGGATVSDLAPCNNYFVDPYDVWYSFETGPLGGDLEISIVNVLSEFGPNRTMIVQVLEGTCDEMVSFGCLSGSNQNTDYTTTFNLSGLSPFTTYYIRVFPFGTHTEPYFFNIYAEGPALTNTVAVKEVPTPQPLRIDRVFPVPTADRLEVHYSARDNAPVYYQLFSAMGSLVMQGQGGAIQGQNTLQLSMGNLPTGVYFLSMYQNGLAGPPQKIVKL